MSEQPVLPLVHSPRGQYLTINMQKKNNMNVSLPKEKQYANTREVANLVVPSTLGLTLSQKMLLGGGQGPLDAVLLRVEADRVLVVLNPIDLLGLLFLRETVEELVG